MSCQAYFSELDRWVDAFAYEVTESGGVHIAVLDGAQLMFIADVPVWRLR